MNNADLSFKDVLMLFASLGILLYFKNVVDMSLMWIGILAIPMTAAFYIVRWLFWGKK